MQIFLATKIYFKNKSEEFGSSKDSFMVKI
jgi:hypothetical protein